MKYDYKEAVCDDIRRYLKEEKIDPSDCHGTRSRFYDDLYDKLFVEDSVTGNASGSYTMNAFEAEECLLGNRWLLRDAVEALAPDAGPDKLLDAEWCDVLVRCYLLDECLTLVLLEYEKGVF